MNNEIQTLVRNSSVRIAAVGLVAVLALFLLAQTFKAVGDFGRPNAPATDVITVQGTGQATMAPDVAKVYFTVQNSASTVAAAQDATTKQANKAIDFVKQQGIEEKDIKTLAYNISPEYSYPNPCPPNAMCPAYTSSPKIIGYQVSQTIQVTLRDLDTVGEMLAGIGALGVQNLNGPEFGLDDPTAGYAAARADAIAKAKQQAEELSDQLGVRLGKIVNFSEASMGYPYPMAYGRGGMDAYAMNEKAVPSVPVGENTYTASVSITYEIR